MHIPSPHNDEAEDFLSAFTVPSSQAQLKGLIVIIVVSLMLRVHKDSRFHTCRPLPSSQDVIKVPTVNTIHSFSYCHEYDEEVCIVAEIRDAR